jgi:AcrR family transcriptional regulator
VPAPSSSASRGRAPAQGPSGGTEAPSRTERTKSERTRERLLLAAASTLSRLGYAGMRLADVGEEAGVQAPAIYYYWPSREQLIEEVVTVGTTRLREYVAAALAAAPPEATALDRLDIAVQAQPHRRGGRDRAVHHPARCRQLTVWSGRRAGGWPR